jgi:Tfp pilus assembly protein PilF
MDPVPAETAPPGLPAAYRLSLALSAACLLGGIILGISHDLRELRRAPNIDLEPLLRGQSYFEGKAHRKAVHEFKIAATILKTDPSPLLALATTYGELGENDAQLEAVREAVLRAPDTARVQLALGTILARRGELAEAQHALERSLELEEGSSEARTNLGIVLMRQHQPAKALVHLDAVLQLDPNNEVAQAARRKVQAQLALEAERGSQP